MSYLRYLCLFAFSGIQHIALCFCFVILRLGYRRLPVSLNCPFLFSPSVFFVYLKRIGAVMVECRWCNGRMW